MTGQRRRRNQIGAAVGHGDADPMALLGKREQHSFEMPEHRHQRDVEEDRHGFFFLRRTTKSPAYARPVMPLIAEPR